MVAVEKEGEVRVRFLEVDFEVGGVSAVVGDGTSVVAPLMGDAADAKVETGVVSVVFDGCVSISILSLAAEKVRD